MGKSHTKILSEQVIPYRPILVNRLLGGNIHASILLTQMIYWADFNNPFYKFKTSPAEKYGETLEEYKKRVQPYKIGDSWTEELQMSVRKFDTALKVLAHKKNEIIKEDDSPIKSLITYQTDKYNKTWYELDLEGIDAVLAQVYEDSPNYEDQFMLNHPDLQENISLRTAKNANLEMRKTHFEKCEKDRSYNTETTSENTSERVSKETRCVAGATQGSTNSSIDQSKPRRKLIKRSKESKNLDKRKKMKIKPKPFKKKEQKAYEPTPIVIDYLKVIDEFNIRTHVDPYTKVYREMCIGISKLIKGTFYTKYHENCGHMIGKKISIDKFKKALFGIELLLNSPEYGFNPRTRESINKWQFPDLLYRERANGNGTKSLFARCYRETPKKKIEIKAKEDYEALTEGKQKYVNVIVKEWKSMFGVTPDIAHVIRCVKYTLPEFYDSINDQLPDQNKNRFFGLDKKVSEWLVMIKKNYEWMDEVSPSILNSENTKKKAYNHFGKKFFLKGYRKRSRNDENLVPGLLAQIESY